MKTSKRVFGSFFALVSVLGTCALTGCAAESTEDTGETEGAIGAPANDLPAGAELRCIVNVGAGVAFRLKGTGDEIGGIVPGVQALGCSRYVGLVNGGAPGFAKNGTISRKASDGKTYSFVEVGLFSQSGGLDNYDNRTFARDAKGKPITGWVAAKYLNCKEPPQSNQSKAAWINASSECGGFVSWEKRDVSLAEVNAKLSGLTYVRSSDGTFSEVKSKGWSDGFAFVGKAASSGTYVCTATARGVTEVLSMRTLSKGSEFWCLAEGASGVIPAWYKL